MAQAPGKVNSVSIKVCLLMAVVWCCADAPPAHADTGHANTQSVVMIVIDDLRPVLGAYGDHQAHTPHIDDLARRSLMFTNAYAVVPVCGASRAALMTGRKPTASRFISYNARADADLPQAATIPGYFKQHGYRTRALGKLFDVTADSAEEWSEGVWNPEATWHSSVPRDGRHNDLQKAYLRKLEAQTGPPVERVDVGDEGYPDGQVVRRAVTDLAVLADSTQPYLLAVGLRKPHLPFTAPERYWRLFDGVAIRMPSTYAYAGGLPTLALHNSFELRRQYHGVPPQRLVPTPYAQELLHGYYAAVSYVDALVGQLLDAIAQLPEPPVVLLVSDHGWNLGEHTLWTKHSLFDVTLRIPLLLHIPGQAARVQTGLADLLDVFPTLTDSIGLPSPNDLDGVSLLQHKDGKDISVARWLDGVSVRDQRYRYTEWRSESQQVRSRMLFDLLNDPDETQNLAVQPQFSDTVARMHQHVQAQGSESPWADLLRAIVQRRDNQGF